MKNNYIVVEGIEGSGKTTIVNFINKILIKFEILSIISVCEPGGTNLAKDLGELIKKKNVKEKITYETELLIFYAARSQLIENVIKPAIRNGIWVISDRNELSSQAYQGGGRKLNSELIEVLKKNILGNLEPDLIFYLDITPRVALNRVYSRKKIDRIEEEDLIFFERTRCRYIELAAKNEKIVTVDAGQSLEKVKKEIYKNLLLRLKLNENKKKLVSMVK